MKLTPLFLALALALVGCEGDPPPKPKAESSAVAVPTGSAVPSASASATPDGVTAKKGRQPKNVLLITVDSLRSDMPWAGYDKEIAPHLTKLAKESVVYNRAYTISSFTSKSVGGLLAGRYPSSLYRGSTFFTTYSHANLFFPELLQKAGVRTMAGHAHLYFDRGKNLRQGFDEWRLVDGLKWNAETDESVTSDKMTPLAIDMLSPANTKDRFFLWLHYMDPHDKYVQHEEGPNFGRRARNLYDNEVWYTDMWIHKLLEHARKQPWWKDTAVIISSDHGEAFGEHDMWKHAFALWEVLTHVPLIVHIPGVDAKTIDARRSQIDLAPTIMDLLGEKPPAEFVGKSMVPEIFGEAEPDDREPIMLDLPADSYNPETKVVIKGDLKLIREPLGKHKLYNLTKDPNEKRNLAGDPKHKADLERMKKLLEESWGKQVQIKPYGGRKLSDGSRADGPQGPDGYEPPEPKKK